MFLLWTAKVGTWETCRTVREKFIKFMNLDSDGKTNTGTVLLSVM